MKKLAVVVVLVAAASVALAQSFTGTILGTIKDPSGAVVPGVTVTITNAATNVRTEAITDGSGSYVAPELVPGRYTVEATLPGFKRAVREGIVLQVQQRTQVDIVMAVGEVTEAIEVTASAQLTVTSPTRTDVSAPSWLSGTRQALISCSVAAWSKPVNEVPDARA